MPVRGVVVVDVTAVVDFDLLFGDLMDVLEWPVVEDVPE